MKLYDLMELVVGTSVFLISLLFCVIISNKITSIFNSTTSRNINLVLLVLHLIIIVTCVMVIRSVFYKNIRNKDILNSIFTLTGPIIGLSSIYMSDTLHAIVALY